MTNFLFPADLVTFTEEIINRKLHSLCSVLSIHYLVHVEPVSDFCADGWHSQERVPKKRFKAATITKRFVLVRNIVIYFK